MVLTLKQLNLVDVVVASVVVFVIVVVFVFVTVVVFVVFVVHPRNLPLKFG